MAFVVERIKPTEFGWEDALEVAEVVVSAFTNDPGSLYMLGDELRYNRDYLSVFTAKASVTKRLNLLVANAKNYVNATSQWARVVQAKVYERGYDTYVLRETATNRIVGEAIWRYPDYLTDALEQELSRTSTWFKLSSGLTLAWNKVRNKIDKLLGRAIFNKRFLQFFRGLLGAFSPLATLDDLRGKSYEELKETLDYPHASMGYLMLFCIHNQYHSKGLGQQLLRESLARIPATGTPFNGPQKIYLEATRHGRFLYEKLGFKDSGKVWEPDFTDIPEASRYMVLTR